MTPPTIFCPNSHLILFAARCATCGWQRPPLGQVGEAAWGPLVLKAGLGGLGRHVFVGPAVAQGVLALPMSNHEIVGVGLLDGKERWRITIDGLVTRQLVSDGDSILMTLSDERSLEVAGLGQLTRLDPLTGKLITLWQAEKSQLSSPTYTETHIVLSTASAELVAFRRSATLAVAWRTRLKTFWMSAPPHIAAGNVLVCDGLVMQAEGWLRAFNLQTGQLVWENPTKGLIQHPLVSTAGKVIFQNGKKHLVAWDAASGREIWGLELDKFYTAPIVGGERVFLVTRGAASSASAEHYLLKALDPASGNLLWQTPLPARVLAAPLWAEGQVYLVSEDGRLFAFREQNGQAVFMQQIGSEEDPPRMALVVADGLLLAGTLSGKVSALQVEQPRQQLESPEAYLQRGELESAAASYALQGNFEEAARLYADGLRDTPKALALYEYTEKFREAAELCARQGLLAEAEKYYEQAGDLPNQAEIRLKRGDGLGAAHLFEKNGQLARAATLFEKADDFHHAMSLYRQLNDEPSILRVHRLMPRDSRRTAEMVERLLQQGHVAEAAEEAYEADLLEKAVELFKQASLPARELDSLLVLAQKKDESWIFEQIAELAHAAERFLDEAQALEHLGHPRRAAEAYWRAAMRTTDAARAVGLYEKAAQQFGEINSETDEAACHDAIARLLRTPIVQIQGNTAKEFTEYKWNTLELTIHNRGYGPAKEVHWYVSPEHFDVDDQTAEVWRLAHLGPDAKKGVRISVRPKKGETGDAVPFTIQWNWKNQTGQDFKGKISVLVPVKGEHDSRPTGQPVIIQPGATYVQTEKYVAGDDVSGQKGDNVIISRARKDEIPAGQKGNRVEVDRTGVRISSDNQHAEPTRSNCPKCNWPNDPDAKFCADCRHPLTV